MRQKQVEARRGLREHRLIDGKRVVRHVHGAEDPGVEVPVLRSPEQGECPQHLRMTAPPVGEASVPVVGGAIAVQRDAHLNAVRGEQIAQALVELDAIRVDGQAEPRHRIYHGAQREQQAAQPFATEQQRFTAVQHHGYPGQNVALGVLAYPLGGLPDCFLGHNLGLAPPALIGVFINIAMVAGKVTAAAYLEDVLAYVRRHAANSADC
jgi:hypothetical protein